MTLRPRRQSAPRKTPFGSDGKPICKCGCGRPIGKGRLSWHSQECVDRWMIANNAQHVRILLRRRDRGVCAMCGRDADRAKDRYERSVSWTFARHWDPRYRQFPIIRHGRQAWLDACARWDRRFLWFERARKVRAERMRAGGWPIHVRTSWWEADHIVPVAEGGGQPTTLDAYRTLCWPCHRKVTAELRRRLSSRKGEAVIVAEVKP